MPRVKGKNAPKSSPTHEESHTKSTSYLQELESTRDEGLKQFGKAEKTHKAYKGYLDAGKKWLKELVECEQQRGVDKLYQIPLDKLAVAFDKPPNQYSAVALELFLTSKCFGERKCGKSTAEGIHGAFCQYWDKM